MTVKEFEQKIKTGEAQVLTVESAKMLVGKTIYWYYLHYKSNTNTIKRMKVGKTLSEWDYYSTQPCEGYSCRTEEWKTFMSASQIQEKKDTLMLLDADGNDSYIRCHLNSGIYDVPVFTCSDIDREVYFLIAEK